MMRRQLSGRGGGRGEVREYNFALLTVSVMRLENKGGG